jgi:DNA-binding transcriptional MerR regulator
MAEPVEPLVAPQTEEIPDKLYFRIGEVARITGVKQYVLRFWESEFPGLGPKKSGTGHRLFRRKDVEMVLEIKRLLYEKRFTIEGARKWMEQKPKPAVVPKTPKVEKQRRQQAELFPEIAASAVSSANLDAIRKELKSILDLLR